MSKEARGSRQELFFNQGLPQILVMKRIVWHRASSTLERLLCWWISSELYVDRCYSCWGTINSVVIIIDFPQVIIISHILDIQGFNAALQMAFWLIGTMLQGSTNIEAILKRSVALLLCKDYPSWSLMLKWFQYTAGVKLLWPGLGLQISPEQRNSTFGDWCYFQFLYSPLINHVTEA